MNTPDQKTDVTTQSEALLTKKELFIGFAKLSLTAFGGVLPLAYRTIVEERKWLKPQEFLDQLGICQFLPGPSMVNLAVILGSRFQGVLGSFAALAGLIGPPFLIVLMIAILYQHFQNIEIFHNALKGVTVAAAGLISALAIKIAEPIFKKKCKMSIVFLLLAFIGVGLLKFPLILVLLSLAPFSVYIFLRKARRET